MWKLRQPDEACIRRFLARQAKSAFSYDQVGATAESDWPLGFDHDRNRVCLGAGAGVFENACDAFRRWRQFPAAWTEVQPRNAPLTVGTTVAMVAHAYGQWWINACQIVYVIDDVVQAADGQVRRFGFAYGTLREHVECGEERFLVEQLPDGSVWYDLRAFSRPRLWCVRLAYPLARRLQRRFVHDSQRSMVAAVSQ